MLKKVIMSDLGEIYTGNTPSKKNNEYYESNDIMFIKPDIMSFDIENIAESNEYISEKARDKARIVPANSLLVSCIGNIGKLAINKEEASFNQQINAIVHNENIVSSKYLAYLLKYNQKRLEAIANAPVVPIINKTQFSNFEVSIHESLETQKKIVEALGKAQELIDKRKEQIEVLDELVKSRFIEMFGDTNLNPKGWSKTSWEYIFNTTTGKLDSNAMVEGGIYPFFTCAKERFWIDKYDFDCEALLLAGNNAAGIYDVKYYNGKFNAYQRTYVLTLINNEYSYVVFKHQLENKLSLLRHQSKGSNTRYLTMGILKELEFIIPPIELQNEFADFVNQVDKLKSKMETSLKELEDNFNSLMQKAFKGELF